MHLPARLRLPRTLFAIGPAILLSACGVPVNTELDAKLVRAEAAAVRAEAAQRAAESAAVQAEAAATPAAEESDNPDLDESRAETANSANDTGGNRAL